MHNYLARYARGPSATTVEQAVRTHEAIRSLLGETDYATLLQGSYKNDTALWDMNDVDIVVAARSMFSSVHGGSTGGASITWDEIFGRIERTLDGDARYRGRWTRQDKCIRVNTGVKVDVVPVVRVGSVEVDPVAVYSFRSRTERLNWPRAHYVNGAAKSRQTSGAYKQAVRLFKRWARSWFGDAKTAPSYYIESLVYAQVDACFTGDLAVDFIVLATRMLQLSHGLHVLPRVAGAGNLLTPSEWDADRFGQFQATLGAALTVARASFAASTDDEARRCWTRAFNGQTPA